MKKILATATLGMLMFTSNPAMAAPTITDYQQSEIQNLSAWPRIRDGIISSLIGESENNDNNYNDNNYDSYDDNYYNPPPPRQIFPPPPPPRPHRHHHHHPHHHYY